MKKAIKIISAAFFLIGFAMVLCEVSTDDYFLMELHQEHNMNYVLLIAGVLMWIPMTIIAIKEGKNDT